MQFASCIVPVVPVRKHPAHESEMVNQLLFGEWMEILESGNTLWCRIKSISDGYEGWVNRLQVTTTNTLPGEVSPLLDTPEVTDTIITKDGSMQIPAGSTLPGLKNGKGLIGEVVYNYEGNRSRMVNEIKPDDAKIAELVAGWLQAPYLWGGRTRMGVDCSGFTQVVFKMLGVALLRDASQQATQGETVDFIQQARCGDLAFFDDEEGRIYHVGLLMNSHEIVHASGKVRRDRIDNAGIINADNGERTHKLRIIKRYF